VGTDALAPASEARLLFWYRLAGCPAGIPPAIRRIFEPAAFRVVH